MTKFILVLALMASTPVPQSDWISYTEESGLFSVLVPGKLEKKEKLVETSARDYLLQSVFYKAESDSADNHLYLINYHMIMEGMYDDDTISRNADLLLQMADDMSSTLQDGQLLYASPVISDDFSSVEYRISYGQDKYNLKGKFFMNRNHLYSLQVYTTKDKALNRNMDLFIDSFRILKK
jgi:hypothetical protein